MIVRRIWSLHVVSVVAISFRLFYIYGKGGFQLPKAMQPRTFVDRFDPGFDRRIEGLTNQRCHILSNTKARKLERQKEIEAKITFVLVQIVNWNTLNQARL